MFSLIVAGRLLGASLACGLNLYATIALVGIASRFGWIDFLPVSLRGLENGILIGAAITLFMAKVVSSAIPVVDSAFETVHTVVRPVAAMTLALLALEAVPWPLRLTGAAVAGCAAFAAHAAKVGLRLIVMKRRAARVAVSFLEDLVAVALAITALLLPVVAIGVIALFLLLLALVGPALWRAAAFGARALLARVRGFFGTRDWRDAREMPGGLRSLIPPVQIGDATPRALRAAMGSGNGAGQWRNGWIVIDQAGPSFLYRGILRPHRISLPTADATAVRHGFLSDVVEIGPADHRFTLFLLKDGPTAETAVGVLRTYS